MLQDLTVFEKLLYSKQIDCMNQDYVCDLFGCVEEHTTSVNIRS